jgi:hypothetical protein
LEKQHQDSQEKEYSLEPQARVIGRIQEILDLFRPGNVDTSKEEKFLAKNRSKPNLKQCASLSHTRTFTLTYT